MHSNTQRQNVSDMLSGFCHKINEIRNGCLTIDVNMLDEGKLLRFLRLSRVIALRMKNKLYKNADIMTDLMKEETKMSSSISDEHKQQSMDIMSYVISKFHLEISVTAQDILSFLDNYQQSLKFVIQVRIALSESYKADPQMNAHILGKFDKHPQFQKYLEEILTEEELVGAVAGFHIHEKVCFSVLVKKKHVGLLCNVIILFLNHTCA